MPTTARANRTDGDAEAGAAEAEKCKKARVTLPVLSVLQTVLQDAAEALADKTNLSSPMCNGLSGSMLCTAAPDGSALDGGCGGSPGGTGAARLLPCADR